MSRPIQARISLGALRHNYWLAKRTAHRSSCLAVVKANAYGHGVDRVARALHPCDGFATLELESAIRLRERLQTPPILLLEGFFDTGELITVASFGLATVVHHHEQLRMLELGRPARMLDVWVKLNTGMNRLGFAPEDLPRVLDRLKECRAAKSVTLMTHFSSSDAPPGVAGQLARFREATRGLRHKRSLANTAAIFAHPETHADTVRLGIGLYGATPFAERSANLLGLRPAMTLASKLISVQELRAGDAVGYSNTFTAEREMRIGIVACGYADGYPRHAPTGTPVLVGGVRTRTVGRVSMDMLTVDLTPLPQAAIGTDVVLWGEGMPVDEVATAAGTVGYELLCAVAPRVPVVEVD